MSTASSPLMVNNNYKPINNDIPETGDGSLKTFEPFESVIGPFANPPPSKGHVEKSNKKLIAVIALFIISLASFVSQTELTSYLYNSLDFNQPYLLLLLTHSSWTFIWPIQVLTIALYKHFKRCKKHNWNAFNYQILRRNISESLKNQHKNVYKTSGVIINEHYIDESEYPKNLREFISTKSIKYIIKCIFILTIILNLAGITWYVAMSIAPASDITAIYNCSAFSALIFAFPILKEKFTYTKLSSVLIAIFGVFCVAYSTDSGAEQSTKSDNDFPHRLLGDAIIGFGAILYGLYEVLYKKLVCPSSEYVSSRRQVAFSNFCASLIGIATFSTVWIIIVVVDVLGISKFDPPSGFYVWFIIGASIVSNLIFSLSFLSLMSLTSPVLSSVSSLITILFVGLFEWVLFGIKLTFQQVLGDLLIAVGFVVLSFSYWSEITEEDVDDPEDVDPTDTEE